MAQACAAGSLLLLATFFVAHLSTRTGSGGAAEPWPLGAGGTQAGPLLAWSAIALGLSLGWAVPGLSLALLSDRSLGGAPLLGRSLGLGIGYIVLTGLGHAILFGHAPGHGALLALLAVPPALLLAKTRTPTTGLPDPILAASVVATVTITGILWPKLAREGLNGDGTEAYELARSLEHHPLPRWDMERWEGPGRFGTPAVNPFLTNSYLASAGMTVLGRGELAARLPLVPALVIATAIAGGLARRPGRSGWGYLAAMSALYLMWNAYYVGYEPPFTDLAEPAATDTLMVALWLAGFREIVEGSEGLGAGFLLLAAGILYSGPLLAVPALVCLGIESRRWRPLVLWASGLALTAALMLAYGVASGDLADWLRQVRSEYWYDLVDHGRRSPTARFAMLLLLLTGGLPLVAVGAWRRLSSPSRALLCATGVYLAIALVSSYKNVHYLAPLPFLLAPPALEASGRAWRLAAIAVVAVAFALSWPARSAIHRETVELGQKSCVGGLGYEEASLAADVVYRAFAPTGQADRFAVGKHTFVRYAMERGGEDCRFRLSRSHGDGWIPVAGGEVSLAVRDPDEYARWRLQQPASPSSVLFPRASPPALPQRADEWPATIAFGRAPGSALLIEDFDPRDTVAPRARILVPGMTPGMPSIRLAFDRPHPAVELQISVNGQPAAYAMLPVDSPEADLAHAAGWRPGWNVVAVRSRPGGLSLRTVRAGSAP